MSLLSISGLSVRYGPIRALDQLDLTVRRNEMFVLLGGSGSGKTTLLRAIGGFVRPDSGRIILDGTDLSALPPHRRPVNTMFQSYALFPHLSVASNIGFGLRQRGLSRAQARARVEAMLALVRLEGFGNRRPLLLSGGQQQRVALARSLAPSPVLLLLDEPLSALDQNLRIDTRAELVRLRRQLGVSFILVTHDQTEALTMADRIGVMRDGHMAQVGTPQELYERPVDRFVASFLGAANVLPCRVAMDGVTVHLPAQQATVRAERAGAAGPGLLALRAERLRIDVNDATGAVVSTGAIRATGTTDAAGINNASGLINTVATADAIGTTNQLPGVVVENAYSGNALTVMVRLRDGTLLRVARGLADGLAAAQVEPGTPVVVGWQPDACILLPE